MLDRAAYPLVYPVDAAGGAYEYRGADLRVDGGGATFSFTLLGYPLLGWTGLSTIETAMKLIDAWLDQPKGGSVIDTSRNDTRLISSGSGRVQDALL